jgi:DNA-binding response OmpR family regulator
VSKRETLLLIAAGANPMEELSQRLRTLGYRVLRTKTLEQGYAALSDPRFTISVALVPPDLPTPDVARTLAALCDRARHRTLRVISTGIRPETEERALFRRAGVEFALWEPFDDHTLQFQVNRALAGHEPAAARRRALRVPANWPVQITTGKRQKQAKIYCISAQGAYLATPRPSLPKALVHFSLPLPSGDLRLAGEVVMTNVPGNLVRENLPVGMGVRFTGHSSDAERAIRAFTEERAQALLV